MKRRKAVLSFLICSIAGIIYFFVPVIPTASGMMTPMVEVINVVKALLGGTLPAITLLFSLSVVIACLLEKTGKFPALSNVYGSVKTYSLVIYIIGTILGAMIYFKAGPEIILASDTGVQALNTAGSSIVTIILAGIVVPLVAEYGLLEMIGAIIEPLMRPVFHVPGCAAIDAVSSFVANPTIGIFFTSKLYTEKRYTTREACSIAVNFSIISLGFFAVMCELAGAMECYGAIVLTSFLLAFVVAAIMIRIPPISRLPNTYIDKSAPAPAVQERSQGGLITRSLNAAVSKADSVDAGPMFKKYLLDVIVFSQKIAPFIIVVCTITLLLVKHTPIFNYLGMPFIPLLKLLGIPAASEIAPAMVLGLAEVSMPSALLTGMNIPMASRFFVVVLSSLQIIAWAGSAPSILESEIPLGAGKLFVLFFVRTLVSMPLIAAVTFFLF